MTTPKPPTCAVCKAPLVIRRDGHALWIVCCARCPRDAVVCCGERRAVEEWRRREQAQENRTG